MACDAGPANVCRTCEILLQVFDNVPAEGVRGGSVVKAAERSARWIKLGCTLEQSDRWVRTCLFAGSCRPLRSVLGVLTRPIIGRQADIRNASIFHHKQAKSLETHLDGKVKGDCE